MKRKLAIIVTFLMASFAMLIAGCSEKLPEYENIITALDNYREQYSTYRPSRSFR